MKSIALIACGNYHRIWLPVAEMLRREGYQLEFYCMNYKAKEFVEKEFPGSVKYLYEQFNYFYDKFDVDESNSWHYRSLMVDKNHYKNCSGLFQEKVACVFSKIMSAWILESKSESFFFPIIESIDTDIFYTLLKMKNKKVFVHTHLRHLNRSFWSTDKFESLPEDFLNFSPSRSNLMAASEFIEEFRANPKMLSYQKQLSDENLGPLYIERWKNPLPVYRFVRNLGLSWTVERHNKQYNPLTKLKVFGQRVIVPINRLVYSLFEKYYLRPVADLPEDFAYFPLQFSPESSINTPSPEYIDQLSCVKDILFSTKEYRLLIVKEHPAMFLKRRFSFYRELKRLPYVRFVDKDRDSLEILKAASWTYTVTGTISMEALLLDRSVTIMGRNFLKYAVENGVDKIEFMAGLIEISWPFVLYSPPPKDAKSVRYRALFEQENIDSIANSMIKAC